MDKIRVLIADDNQGVRQGLQTFLELREDVDVVGEASNGLEAVEQTQRLQPDVVLMDLAMPRMDGVEATRRVKALCPNTRVLILTGFGEEEKAAAAVAAGAQNRLLKNVSPVDLVKAIQTAHQRQL